MADVPARADPDPMTETTRKYRRALLIAASILIVLDAYPEIQPTTITALGVKLEQGVASDIMSGGLLLVIAYMLVSFVVYALGDFNSISADPITTMLSAAFSSQKIVGRSFPNIGWSAEEPMWAVLARGRERSGDSRSKVVFTVCWVVLKQIKAVLIHRTIGFWILGFWFPVIFASAAMVGNALPALGLLKHVFGG